MNNNIIQIDELIRSIQENEYIDCSKDDLYDGGIYESIMFYLNFCKNWFIFQQLDKLEDELINGTSDIEPKGILSILKEKGE
jgi:hypothetical protein